MILVPMTVNVSDVALPMSVASSEQTIKVAIALAYSMDALPAYDGVTEFVPSTDEQTILTANKSVYDDITIEPIPENYVDTSDADAVAEDISEGKTAYVDGEKITGTGRRGSTVIASGTIIGSGTTQLQIACAFVPDLIYVIGDLSGDPSLRGVISITIVKDNELIFTADASASATTETMAYSAHGISGYNDASNPHATYSNGVLTIDTVNNTSSFRFNPEISYRYMLVGFDSTNVDGGTFDYTDGDNVDGGIL